MFRILDNVLFGGLLGDIVVLRWVEALTGEPDRPSKTALILDVKRGPLYLIEVMRPRVANGPWTPAIIQNYFEAMLYEMTTIFFLKYIRTDVPFQRSSSRAPRNGRLGNGSQFRKFLREVEQEANRTLKGLPKRWQLSRFRR